MFDENWIVRGFLKGAWHFMNSELYYIIDRIGIYIVGYFFQHDILTSISKDAALALVDNVLTFTLIIFLSLLSHKRQSNGQPFKIAGFDVGQVCRKVLNKYFTTTTSTTSTVTTGTQEIGAKQTSGN